MKIEELQNKLKYLFKDKSLNPNSIKNILQKNQLIKEELQKIFSGNSKKYVSVGKLVISFVKDIQFRKCVSCNKQLNYDQTAAGSLYCSNKCKLKAGNNPFSRKQVKDKIKQRIVEKYGVENPAQAEDVRKKIKQTCMEKYGVENPYQADCCKSKAKQTLFKHYKTDCPLNNEAIKSSAIKHKYLTAYKKIVQNYKDSIQPAFSAEEYKGVNKIYLWKCKKCGNLFYARYDNGKITSRCFNCCPRKFVYTSKAQKEISEFLKSHGVSTVQSDRTIIYPSQLDIVIPQKKIAVQFNGIYWHSTENHKNPLYHLNKILKCEKRGYRLVNIFQFDWINTERKEIVLEKLKSLLDIQQIHIDSDKCVIRELQKDSALQFNKFNSLQNNINFSQAYGVYFQEILIADICFTKNENDVKIHSVCIKNGYFIEGIYKKLFQFLEIQFKGCSFHITINNLYQTADEYLKCGFTVEECIDPKYILSDKNLMFKEDELSENEKKKLFSQSGFYKIYDCGYLKLKK